LGRRFRKLVPVEEALKNYLNEIEGFSLEVEEVPLEEAVGRVLAEDVVSRVDNPPFDRAAMDGYAVVAEDTYGASESSPVILRVVGEVLAGESGKVCVSRGCAVRISTGAPVPEGANAVVPVEECECFGDHIKVYRQVPPWKNVDRRGEDIRKGEILMTRGSMIAPVDVAALASCEIEKVRVFRKVRISLIFVGDELVELGEKRGEGQVINSSGPMLRALLSELPVDISAYVKIGDDLSEIKSKLREVLPRSDVIVTVAGTSVGKRDLIPLAVLEIGGKILTHGVTQMPGRPVLLSLVDHKPLIGLPGYPVATYISFMNFVRPVVEKLAGISGAPVTPEIWARLGSRVPSRPGVRHYVRVKIVKEKDGFVALPVRISGAGIVSSLLRADGLLVVPENVEGFQEGEIVKVKLMRRYLTNVGEENLPQASER